MTNTEIIKQKKIHGGKYIKKNTQRRIEGRKYTEANIQIEIYRMTYTTLKDKKMQEEKYLEE